MKDFLKSKTVLFGLFVTVALQLYWLFGQEGYRTNLTGYLILALPLVLLIFIVWKRVRGGEA